ncbi:hypothetical protein E4U47_006809 [Claviceps purpurea]|nr:hypothetical protein E4U38_006759 [Claviceps purpurea]KAG6151659.1 hypothetical protein E4U11_007776 [Claviceps purpurea]KAG6177917.1 hypothetical protein E4U36_006862 [Claviceps purpurea]KAG6239791.1 hypothetical protein E4U23_007691 [Claviceps purpurea]KAG6264648.1 hypothetical protein E4U47_006809 [Claviceps purpurea]
MDQQPDLTTEWKRQRRDIEKATTIDANNRVAYVMRDYIKRDLTRSELTVRFREDFESWTVKSFNLISNDVRREFRDFLIARGVKIAIARGLKIPIALARVVEEDNDIEGRLTQMRFTAIDARNREQLERIRMSAAGSPRQTQQLSPVVALRPPSFPTFPMHTQQARPAPGTDLQPPLAYRQLQQLPPKVMESQIPSTYEKKNMSVLREWSSQDSAGSPHVKTTAGSDDKLESAPVAKAVSSPANSTLAEFRHGTPRDAVEEYPSTPLKSAAVRPFDEPEQRPDEALDKGAPTDEEETSRNEDSADAEESDGPSGDQMRRVKETLRGEFAPATYILSPVQGSAWSPLAPKLLRNTLTLVCHLFTDFESYFRLVERLVP